MSAPGFKPSANQAIEGNQQTSLDPLRHQMVGRPSPGSEYKLAHIDIAGLQAAGIPTPMGGRDRTTDEYRLIKRAILQLATSEAENSRRNLVMVTSTQPGEGKTFTAIALAMSIVAEADTDVLLVDLD